MAPVSQGRATTMTDFLGRALLQYAKNKGFESDVFWLPVDQKWSSTYIDYPGLGSYDIAEKLNSIGYKP
jgi:hypothetical protein